jgi:hypothetical protein
MTKRLFSTLSLYVNPLHVHILQIYTILGQQTLQSFLARRKSQNVSTSIYLCSKSVKNKLPLTLATHANRVELNVKSFHVDL